MNNKRLGAIVLIAGLAMTIFTSIVYFTTKKVVDLGDVEITRQEPHYVNWSPWIGIVIMIIGVALVMMAPKNNGWKMFNAKKYNLIQKLYKRQVYIS